MWSPHTLMNWLNSKYPLDVHPHQVDFDSRIDSSIDPVTVRASGWNCNSPFFFSSSGRFPSQYKKKVESSLIAAEEGEFLFFFFSKTVQWFVCVLDPGMFLTWQTRKRLPKMLQAMIQQGRGDVAVQCHYDDKENSSLISLHVCKCGRNV